MCNISFAKKYMIYWKQLEKYGFWFIVYEKKSLKNIYWIVDAIFIWYFKWQIVLGLDLFDIKI